MNIHRIVSAGAVGLALAAPLAADAAVSDQDLAAIQQQLQSLAERVQQLEARNAELEQKNAALAGAGAAEGTPTLDELAAKVVELEETNDRQTDQLAQSRGADWANRIRFKGDLRYRHEQIDREGTAERLRDRIRARVGFDAKVNDDISVSMQLATGGTDPRSSNQTLGENSAAERRSFGLDQAYFAWRPGQGALTLQGGKMPYTFVRPGNSGFYDGDLNPEGLNARWQSGTFYANAYYYQLQEISTRADPNVIGLQVGNRFTIGEASTLNVGLHYSDYGAVEGRSPFFGGAANANNANGNTVACTGTGAATVCRLPSDFNVLEGHAELTTRLGGLPLMAFVNYLQNQEAITDYDTALSVGFMVGKTNPGTRGSWEAGLTYQDIDKDSQFGQVLDSDFGDGRTDSKGLVLRLGWVAMPNWTVNATYFRNTLNKDVGTELDYDRLQLDLNYRFQ